MVIYLVDLTTRRSNNIYYFYSYNGYKIVIFKTIRFTILLRKTKNLKICIPTPYHTLWLIAVYLRVLVYLSIVFVKAPSHCMISSEVSKNIIFYYYVLITALFTAIFHNVLTIYKIEIHGQHGNMYRALFHPHSGLLLLII